jgi:hypothetical protein
VTDSLSLVPASSSFRQCATSVHQSVLSCGLISIFFRAIIAVPSPAPTADSFAIVVQS